MKFGHPRVYNPWSSPELAGLQKQSGRLMDRIDRTVKKANAMVTENRILAAQIRDCYLTVPEQIARMDALDEVGAPR